MSIPPGSFWAHLWASFCVRHRGLLRWLGSPYPQGQTPSEGLPIPSEHQSMQGSATPKLLSSLLAVSPVPPLMCPSHPSLSARFSHPLAPLHSPHPSSCVDIYISKAQCVFMILLPSAKQGFASQIYSQARGGGKLYLLWGISLEAAYSLRTKSDSRRKR